MNKQLKKLVADRKALLDKIDAILTKSGTENRDLNPTEQTEHDGHVQSIRGVDAQIKRVKDQIELRDAQTELDTETRGAGQGRSDTQLPGDLSTQDRVSRFEQRDLNRFSYCRAVNRLSQGRPLEGIEAEMHQEAAIEARNNGTALQGNLSIPQLLMQRGGVPDVSAMRPIMSEREYKEMLLEQRSITATGTTAAAGDQGGLAIQTNVGAIIERFYAKLMVRMMGVTVLDGLVGNVLFPRHVTDDQAVVKGENVAAPVSSSTMNSITLAPRRVPVVMEVSRQFTMQTSPAVEAYLRNDLSFQIAKIIDGYCISGSGGAGQPYGVINTPGITTLYAGATNTVTAGVPAIVAPVVGTNVDGAALSFADTILMIRAIALQNAEQGQMGWLTNPSVKAFLQLTPQLGSTFPTFVWPSGSDTLNGYRAGVTTQVPGNLTKGAGINLSALIFGNWADALVGQWGGMDMLINPFSKDDQGLIRINAWTWFDFNIRRALSFAAILDAKTF